MDQAFSRRSFVAGAAVAAASSLATTSAFASEKAGSAEADANVAGAPTPTTPAFNPPSWATKPAPISDDEIVETIETEVLILGAGNAGCSAACSAVENGAKVLVCEKTAQVNGRGGVVGACNSRLNKELGMEIEPVAAQYRWVRTCGSRANEALITMWFRNSGPAMDWLLDKADQYGATYSIYAGYAGNAIIPEEPDAHSFGMGDFAMPPETGYFVPTALLYQSSIDRGAEYMFEAPAVQLVQDEATKRVQGAIVSTADGYKKVLASKATILATGDIAGDPEMMTYYCESRMQRILRNDYAPVGVNTGDGHKMGMWAGGVMQDGPLPTALHPQAYSMFHGPFMFVNKNGQRFFNEANWVQAKSLQMLNQPEAVAFSIFDANFGEDTKDSLQYGGGMFWDTMSRTVEQEFDPQQIVDLVEGEAAAGKDVLGNETAVTAWKCDTLEELADAIGVNKENFLKQVEEYNAMCEAGEDTQFEKEAHFLYPIKQAPFYATKTGPCMLAVVGGLKVNTDLAVIDAQGEAIPGLYAIGNTSGDLYAVDYPINMPGNSNGRCLTWGWLVGKTVAAL
ncbi:MAG: FAD-binding protein [Coriobacteriia bacterium]|nr:FAD-binding protein [Coriobacteriia bacterium]